MAQNQNPIFTLTPHIGWATASGTAANNSMDGTGTVSTVFTAGASGSFVQKMRFKAAGTNIATVARIFINNGLTNATPANNILYDEISLTATAATSGSALQTFELPLNFALPANYVLNVALGSAVAAGYYFSCIGGDY